MSKYLFLVLIVIRRSQTEMHQILHGHNFIICFPILGDAQPNDLLNIIGISFIQLFCKEPIYTLRHNTDISNQNDFNLAKISDNLITMMRFMILVYYIVFAIIW